MLVLVVAGLAGCGVPGSSEPVVVGNAPKLGARPETQINRPPTPDDARTPSELIEKYLQAAAWANGTSPDDRARATDDAASRVREFLTDDMKRQWQPYTDLTVVQATVGPAEAAGGGRSRVTMAWRPVGTLNEQGWVDPVAAQGPTRTTFEVVQSGGGLRIASPPPPGMLLSAEGLNLLYEEHPIYFWDGPDIELVPDLRYLPRSIDPAKRPTMVVNWLRGGPSRWLNQVVQPLPPGIEVSGNVIPPGDSPLVVNLTSKAASLQDRLPHLVNQLRWSLREPVQLQIEQRPTGIDGTSNGYLGANPAVNGAGEPDRYCVVGGQIRPAELRTQRPVPPVVSTPVNTSVVSAAVNHDRTAALVRSVGGKQQLWLGNPDKADPSRSSPTGLTRKSISTPAWVSWPSPGVFVTADGRLFYVPASGGAGAMTDLTPDGFGATISAVAAAPDSRRLAFVAAGRVYVTTVLTVSGTPAVTPPRAVPTDLAEITAVAWSRETRIVVAGRRGGASTLEEVSVDGVSVEVPPLTNLANLTVTRLVGYPRSPLSGPGLSGLPGFLMIEASNRAWRVFTDQVGELYPENRAANEVCTAPFFVD